MLTAIVVGVATTGVALALLLRIHSRYGTLEEDELLERIRSSGCNIHQSAVPILIVAAPLLASFALPALGLWKRGVAFPVALTTLTFSFGASIVVAGDVLAHGPVQYFMGGWAPPWGIEFRIDHLGALMLLLLSVITLLIAVYSKKSISRELPGKEVPPSTACICCWLPA